MYTSAQSSTISLALNISSFSCDADNHEDMDMEAELLPDSTQPLAGALEDLRLLALQFEKESTQDRERQYGAESMQRWASPPAVATP